MACKLGLLDIARLLMMKGASIEHVNSFGNTPVVDLWADKKKSFSRKDFVLAMLPYSTPPLNPANGEFMNPIFQVALSGGVEDIELLIQLGANLHDVDDDGDGIMTYCLFASNLPVFDFVASRLHSEWIHEANAEGRTLLHRVFELRCDEAGALSERLIKAGANVCACDRNGLSVEDIAKAMDTSGLPEPAYNFLERYIQALRSCGYDVELDEHKHLFWPAIE